MRWIRSLQNGPAVNAWPGSPAARAPYVAAYLVKLNEQQRYMSNLRSYLVDHPALVWVLGFPLTPSAHSPWGFDVQASVPARKQLGRILRDLPNQALQFLLTATVRQLQDALPGAKDSSRIASATPSPWTPNTSLPGWWRTTQGATARPL